MHYSGRLKQKHCSNRNINIWPIYRLQPATSCSLSWKSKDTSFVSEIRIRSVISSISTLNFLPSGDLTSSWPSPAPPVNNRQKIGNYQRKTCPETTLRWVMHIQTALQRFTYRHYQLSRSEHFPADLPIPRFVFAHCSFYVLSNAGRSLDGNCYKTLCYILVILGNKLCYENIMKRLRRIVGSSIEGHICPQVAQALW